NQAKSRREGRGTRARNEEVHVRDVAAERRKEPLGTKCLEDIRIAGQDVVEFYGSDPAIGANLKSATGRGEHNAPRRIHIEEVRGQIIGRRQRIGNPIPIDLTASSTKGSNDVRVERPKRRPERVYSC